MDDYVVNMMGGVGGQVVSVVYLVSLVGVVAFRSSCIRKKPLFRIACTIYAASFIGPFILAVLLIALAPVTSGWMGQVSSVLLTAVCPLLFGVSMILIFNSIVCGSETQS